MKTKKETEALSHDALVVMYVVGLLDQLKGKGLMSGEGMKIEPNGRALLKEMEDEGFEPTEAEIMSVIDLMIADGTIQFPTITAAQRN